MNVVFFGTSEFAVESLVALQNSHHKVLAVVTQPDSRRDRGHKIHFTPVKEKALEFGIEIFQPENINDKSSEKYLRNLDADILVVVSYGALLKDNILKIGKYKPINIHPSLLPKYRGAAPIQRTLMNGDQFTGVTIMEMIEKLDAGDIILQKVLDIDKSWNYGTLSNMLSDLGGKLLIDALDSIQAGTDTRYPQDETKHTYAKKIRNDEKYLNLKQNANIINNIIRGLTPKVTPLVIHKGHYLGIIEAEVADDAIFGGQTGEIINIDKKFGILLKCEDGAIWIKKVKPEGKKTMDYKDFVNGKKISIGDILLSKEGN